MKTITMSFFQIILPANINHLSDIIEDLSRWMEQQGVMRDRIVRVQLAVEEALVNVIRYAYQGKEGEVELQGEIADDQRLVIKILDNGTPFDVCTVPHPDISCGIRDRKIGGLGIYLIHKMVDELCYRREGDRNVLTMFIRWSNGNLPRSRQDAHAGA
ncbi:MAG TPA: ATP-binding protein [Syntrophales bacterium]|nr:ATP-binding protein [Syntrophales bacterium]HOD99030.1 ATP-binding protein [Syntrophales bacterium]HOH73798.1 ATP-binding protein [Syntrophales bacterium]HPN07826.1 ATP-binding protein [Syntrophales bacterium]HPX82673.1 ATP-binding protein [Syntrophales bacterium]